jgi:hypothetical protein
LRLSARWKARFLTVASSFNSTVYQARSLCIFIYLRAGGSASGEHTETAISWQRHQHRLIWTTRVLQHIMHAARGVGMVSWAMVRAGRRCSMRNYATPAHHTLRPHIFCLRVYTAFAHQEHRAAYWLILCTHLRPRFGTAPRRLTGYRRHRHSPFCCRSQTSAAHSLLHVYSRRAWYLRFRDVLALVMIARSHQHRITCWHRALGYRQQATLSRHHQATLRLRARVAGKRMMVRGP